jgi:hypothetical protein
MGYNLCIVLHGESYRSGPQLSRTRGTDNYIKRQLLASKSHISLINSLKEKGNNIDTILNTYKLNEKDDNNLINYYKKETHIVISQFHDSIFPGEGDFLNNMYDLVTPILNSYDFIFFIRIDLYLKKYCIQNIILDTDKIQFAHIDSNIEIQNLNSTNFNICHHLMLIPKRFYNIITNKIMYNSIHQIRTNIINSGISINSVGLMINTTHICSTDLGWNPLYIQVGRNYNNLYSTKGPYQMCVEYYYDNIEHKFIHDIDKTLKYWAPYLQTDTLDENLKLLNETF